jgi:hypothetical protein
MWAPNQETNTICWHIFECSIHCTSQKDSPKEIFNWVKQFTDNKNLKYEIHICGPVKSKLIYCIYFLIWCPHKIFKKWSIFVKIYVKIFVQQILPIFPGVIMKQAPRPQGQMLASCLGNTDQLPLWCKFSITSFNVFPAYHWHPSDMLCFWTHALPLHKLNTKKHL